MGTAGNPLKKVLVVCTGNTCRSPMAEGWLNRKLAGKGWAAESAGVVGGLEVADEDGAADRGAERVEGAGEKRGFAGTRRGDEVEGSQAAGGERGAVGGGAPVVLVEES